MRIEVHHYHHADQSLEDKIVRLLNVLEKQQEIIMADLTKLTADVAAETTVDTAVQTLLTNLVAQIKAASGDQAALDALTTQMETNAAALSAAVTANTPAAPAGGTGS